MHQVFRSLGLLTLLLLLMACGAAAQDGPAASDAAGTGTIMVYAAPT